MKPLLSLGASLLIAIIVSSCSTSSEVVDHGLFSKRKHRPGYHVNIKHRLAHHGHKGVYPETKEETEDSTATAEVVVTNQERDSPARKKELKKTDRHSVKEVMKSVKVLGRDKPIKQRVEDSELGSSDRRKESPSNPKLSTSSDSEMPREETMTIVFLILSLVFITTPVLNLVFPILALVFTRRLMLNYESDNVGLYRALGIACLAIGILYALLLGMYIAFFVFLSI